MRSKGRCESASAVRPAAFHASCVGLEQSGARPRGSQDTSPFVWLFVYGEQRRDHPRLLSVQAPTRFVCGMWLWFRARAAAAGFDYPHGTALPARHSTGLSRARTPTELSLRSPTTRPAWSSLRSHHSSGFRVSRYTSTTIGPHALPAKGSPAETRDCRVAPPRVGSTAGRLLHRVWSRPSAPTLMFDSPARPRPE